MKPTPEELQAANVTTSHQELAEKTDDKSQKLLVGIEAVKACQRPHGPTLLWFGSEYAYAGLSQAGGLGESVPPPLFDRSVNPISTRGAHYPHPVLCAPPDF